MCPGTEEFYAPGVVVACALAALVDRRENLDDSHQQALRYVTNFDAEMRDFFGKEARQFDSWFCHR